MKSMDKIWKIVWILGIYIILSVILYLVILYKVEWEHKDLSTYLYFYNCNNNLCSTSNNVDNYYNKILCEDDICPFIDSIVGENLILRKNNISWIYNYITGKVVNNNYKDYKFLNGNILIVTDQFSKQGIINIDGEEIVKPELLYIDDYRDGNVVYKENSMYGIKSSDGIDRVDVNFEDIILIDEEKYAGRKNNLYAIYSYVDNMKINKKEYNFLYVYDDILFVFYDNKVDVLNEKLESTLLMKINTFYTYSTEKERESLKFHLDGEYIYFDIFTSNIEYTRYKYNIVTKKIV